MTIQLLLSNHYNWNEMNDNDNDNEPLFENYNYYNQSKWNSRTELNIPKSNQIERD